MTLKEASERFCISMDRQLSVSPLAILRWTGFFTIRHYISYAQTDHPDLSVDVIPIGRVTSDLSVFDSLDSREEITFSFAQ